MSCSAAALLWDRSHRDIVRVGISAYGVWPSRETLVSVRQRGREEVALQSGRDLEGGRVPGAPRFPRAKPWVTAAPGRP